MEFLQPYVIIDLRHDLPIGVYAIPTRESHTHSQVSKTDTMPGSGILTLIWSDFPIHIIKMPTLPLLFTPPLSSRLFNEGKLPVR